MTKITGCWCEMQKSLLWTVRTHTAKVEGAVPHPTAFPALHHRCSSINSITSTSLQPTTGSISCVKNKAHAAHRLIEHASLNSWEPQLNFCCIHSRPALVCVMASSATGTPKYVTLVSAEGHCFIVDYKCAMTSKTIKGNYCLPLRPSSCAQIVLQPF